MKLQAKCTMTFSAEDAVPAVLMLRPQSESGQKVLSTRLVTDPSAKIHRYRDVFGNLCERVQFSPGKTKITATCTVRTSPRPRVNAKAEITLAENLPDTALQFLLPSRYCPSDLFFKQAERITRKASTGYETVELIRLWIHRKIRYQYGVSNSSTCSRETLRRKEGVCRDFSHLGITFCRAMGIPARIVVGYLYELEPMDLHAWYEAFLDGQWHPFDATRREMLEHRIVIARGRDAADVAQLTNYGILQLETMEVAVHAAT